MPTAGDIAVLQFGNDALWHYAFLTPSALSTLTVNSGAGTVALTGVGGASGNVMAVPAPLASMNLTLSAPLRVTGTTLSIDVATDSAAGLMTAAQFSTIAGLGTASAQPSTAFATSAQGTKADSALQPGGAGTVSADSGWTGNADSGTKSIAVPSTASLTTLATAMNLAVAGSGTAFLATAEKLKAIETVLVSFKVPNA